MRFDRARSVALVSALLAGLAFVTAGCDDSTSSGPSKLSILLTDGPGAVEEAWVEITGIYLQGTTTGTGEKMWLRQETTGLIDLLTLDDQTETLVADAIVDPGHYPQLRFIVGEGALVVKEGDKLEVYLTSGLDMVTLNAARKESDESLESLTDTPGELQCPSCSETGFKVNLPGGAVSLDGESKILVVDFDVNQSYGRLAGLSTQWVMEPLLIATQFSASGTLSGTVSWAGKDPELGCGGGTVTVADLHPTATLDGLTHSAIPAEDGSYRFSFLEPGIWTLGFEGATYDNDDVVTFVANHPATAEIGSGTSVTADFEITSATCN